VTAYPPLGAGGPPGSVGRVVFDAGAPSRPLLGAGIGLPVHGRRYPGAEVAGAVPLTSTRTPKWVTAGP
jgi:hypothetical protein